jgi:regulator of replication initiation timing
MSDNQNSRTYGIVVTILLLLAAGLGFFFWQKSKNYLEENERMEKERVALESEKNAISASLDSMTNAYSALRTENESLQGRVATSAQQVQQKEAVIRQIKASSAKDLNELRAQVEELKKTKIELETIITGLRLENDQLKAQVEQLTADNAELKGANTDLTGQVQDLAKQLEAQIKKTQSATFKATSFSVQCERRGDKLTTRAKKAREIFVSFDLADVPQVYQGEQKLYMAMTDDKAIPVMSKNPTKVTVNAPAGPVDITAQEVKDVNLTSVQRVTFTHRFDERLKPGNYVVGIYCDRGLLGSATFRLGK